MSQFTCKVRQDRRNVVRKAATSTYYVVYQVGNKLVDLRHRFTVHPDEHLDDAVRRELNLSPDTEVLISK